jgi:type II secretory pathway pseudopilin PulG
VEVLLALVVIALAVLVISAPLRPGRAATAERAGRSARAELEAARDAKYAEIRDAELDFRTGKLSEADWRALDRQLRREAVMLLHRLDETAERSDQEA